MKLLVALLVLMIAAQPVQAGFCYMDLSGGPGDHAGMNHGSDAGEAAHGCCQSPAGDSGSTSGPGTETGCSDMPCGTCVASVAAIPPARCLAALAPVGAHVQLGAGLVTPSHASPPFRPPILIS